MSFLGWFPTVLLLLSPLSFLLLHISLNSSLLYLLFLISFLTLLSYFSQFCHHYFSFSPQTLFPGSLFPLALGQESLQGPFLLAAILLWLRVQHMFFSYSHTSGCAGTQMPGIASLRAFNTSTSDYLIAPVTFIHLKNKLSGVNSNHFIMIIASVGLQFQLGF